MDQEELKIGITVVAARNLVNKDIPFFGKNDAFAVVQVGGQVNKTRTIPNAGKNALWNETFYYTITPESEILIKVFDEDILKNDFIGEMRLTTLMIYEEGSYEGWFSLHKGEKTRD
ncbi:hypothetical protein DSO57_1014831 [Entomophthora muscae]|uniref:Uncharacterized protein n=1 Tax=Entomophthora muscae TaxID=34485 RepID=A0ACC2RK23_9FUNG|nr:hypothetical protein DSO57_1014831 [Entomophthora muscae]